MERSRRRFLHRRGQRGRSSHRKRCRGRRILQRLRGNGSRLPTFEPSELEGPCKRRFARSSFPCTRSRTTSWTAGPSGQADSATSVSVTRIERLMDDRRRPALLVGGLSRRCGRVEAAIPRAVRPRSAVHTRRPGRREAAHLRVPWFRKLDSETERTRASEIDQLLNESFKIARDGLADGSWRTDFAGKEIFHDIGSRICDRQKIPAIDGNARRVRHRSRQGHSRLAGGVRCRPVRTSRHCLPHQVPNHPPPRLLSRQFSTWKLPVYSRQRRVPRQESLAAPSLVDGEGQDWVSV